MLGIDLLIKTPEHGGQGGVLHSNLLTTCAEVPVAKGVDIPAHKVCLEMSTEKKQVSKVDPA